MSIFDLLRLLAVVLTFFFSYVHHIFVTLTSALRGGCHVPWPSWLIDCMPHGGFSIAIGAQWVFLPLHFFHSFFFFDGHNFVCP